MRDSTLDPEEAAREAEAEALEHLSDATGDVDPRSWRSSEVAASKCRAAIRRAVLLARVAAVEATVEEHDSGGDIHALLDRLRAEAVKDPPNA